MPPAIQAKSISIPWTLDQLLLTVRRLPLPVAASVAFAVVSIADVHGLAFDFGQVRADAQKSLALAFFWTLAASLFVRTLGWPEWLGWLLGLAASAATLRLLIVTPDAVYSPALLLGEAAILLTIVAAFPRFWIDDDEALWRFVGAALEGCLIALVAAGLLGLGLTSLVGSLHYLFGLWLDGRVYIDTWVLALAVIWPLWALSTVPDPAKPDAVSPLQFTGALNLLVDWVLVPVGCAYLLVLYAYAAKIAIAWELPRGNVALMVHGFGAYGAALWLVAWPRRDTAATLTRLFHRWFFRLLSVPLALLFVGVSERVVAYGWTEPRVMVAAGGAWLAAMAGLFAFASRRLPIKLIPLSLAVLCLAISFGPWGVVSVSVRDQHARLSTLLARHGILVGGAVVQATGKGADLPSVDLSSIASAMHFLAQHERMDLIEPWFKDAKPWTSEMSDFEVAAGALAAMGLRAVDAWGRPAGSRYHQITTAYGNLSPVHRGQVLVLDINGYEFVGKAFLGNDSKDQTLETVARDRVFAVRFEPTGGVLRLLFPRGEELVADLGPGLVALAAAGPSGVALSLEQSNPAVVNVRSDAGARARIVIERARVELRPGAIGVNSISLWIALDEGRR
ncbi:MAG: DUF4153 domain-containing protein [Alphaproteobacteria bacterium]|nr:DUF4153 domain-containing protein [Alphaproteobacteria bacterium]